MKKKILTLGGALVLFVFAFALNAMAAPLLSPFTQTELNNWIKDRQFPSGEVKSVSFEGRDNVAAIGVIGAERSTGGSFYYYEGIKKVDDFGLQVSLDLYVPEKWESAETSPLNLGMWTSDNPLTAYPLIVFRNGEEVDAGFYTYKYIFDDEGAFIKAIYVKSDVEVKYDDWNTLTVSLDEDNDSFNYMVNGEFAGQMDKVFGGNIGEFIEQVYLNHYNDGKLDYTAHWHVGLLDETAPATPTNLKRYAPDEGKYYNCGDVSRIQKMWPQWDKNTEEDFSHYEYSSFNAPNGTIGKDKMILDTPHYQYSGSWLPNEGTYGFVVRAVDKSGNKSAWALGGTETLEDSCKITYDNTAPTTPEILGFKNPTLSCGAVTNARSITVDWNDSIDNESGIMGYDYEINYPLADGSGFGKWSTFKTSSHHSGSLNEGVHKIKVRAKDNAGNVSGWSKECSITADWTAPSVNIENVSIVKGKLSFTVSGEDNLSGAMTVGANIYNENNSGTAVISIGRLAHNITPGTLHVSYDVQDIDLTQLGNGIYTIRAAIRDYAGNLEYATHQIDVKNTPDEMNECKEGGWQTFYAPEFKNQGDCVSFLQSNENAKENQNKNQDRKRKND